MALRDDQIPPDGDWTTWIMTAGRGAGKSYAGASWIIKSAKNNPKTNWAIVTPNMLRTRTSMDGLVAMAGEDIYAYGTTNPHVELHNGSVINGYSAEQYERLRGQAYHGALLEEVQDWDSGSAVVLLQAGMRMHDIEPRIVATVCDYVPEVIKMLRGVNHLSGIQHEVIA